MDYKKHYDRLIARAKDRQLPENTYIEKHHIVPRCMGGGDQDSNLAELTPEEHYTAHLLLAKIHPEVGGLWFACYVMCSNRLGRSNNKRYGWLRRNFAKQISIAIKDAWAMKYGFKDYYDQAHTIWRIYVVDRVPSPIVAQQFGMALGNVRRTLDFYADVYGEQDALKKADSWQRSVISKNIRANITPEQEARRFEAMRNMDYAARTAKTGSRKGKKNPVYGLRWSHPIKECPHCGKKVKTKRWHFDNCRNKANEESKNQINQ